MDIRYQDLPYGITTIDTGYVRPGLAASHLLVEGDQAVFVDVGTSPNIPLLVEFLRRRQIAPEDVRYVIVTHVHLDHAGGAGTLLTHLPNARLVAHPKGARHLISPERLIQGTLAVYGEERMSALFGEIVPVPKERVIEAAHESTLDLNGRQFLFLGTPGHANHHICIVDEASQGIFTGDTFGVSYREFDTERGNFIIPSTAPVQFHPEKMHNSIDLLASYHPASMYLTHFGRVTDVPRLADDLHDYLDRLVTIVNEIQPDHETGHREVVRRMQNLLVDQLRAHGCTLEQERILTLLGPDLEIGAQGLEIWWKKSQKQEA